MTLPATEAAEKIQVTVKLFASFRLGRTPIETCEYSAGTTVADVVEEKRIPVPEVGIMMVNHRHVKFDHLLKDGDTLAIFPLLGGG